VDNWQKFYKGVDPQNPPKDVRVQIAEMRIQEKQMALQWDQQKFVAELMEERRMNQAELIKTQAEVVKLMAEAEGEADNRDIVRMQTALAALKARDESLRGRVDQLIKVMELESEPERKRVDTGAVRRLVEPSGDGEVEPVSEGEEAGVPGGMG
jgi:hypothetical protein